MTTFPLICMIGHVLLIPIETVWAFALTSPLIVIPIVRNDVFQEVPDSQADGGVR